MASPRDKAFVLEGFKGSCLRREEALGTIALSWVTATLPRSILESVFQVGMMDVTSHPLGLRRIF
ncbi:hypothetical protein [Baaleninema sp.]|uniref:hypothetical protein n=1 Tax=Baaleninema sp. TaxID=3101197 RepID=UPI003D011435